jgi:hypothetical protein
MSADDEAQPASANAAKTLKFFNEASPDLPMIQAQPGGEGN